MLPHTIRDRVSARSSLVDLKVPSFRVIDALQVTEDRSIQIDAVALTMTLMAQAVGIDPHELVTRANRQIAEASALKNPHFEAISAYAAGELK